ncbi:TonB-dependent receptor [Rhodanobacter sp. DHB23]|uniref:TonB-dependent receptor n=1 Tax=Rhodanobacter sp. DHB23 TaxID=2775923 RepID=UPI00178023E6|nr:TonB-dependent receptor [Rhodanobacter sp. DHB23]MBD8872974.1 TonB-dependent receptor [Rhodanobacter sp. DHB23]
MKGKFLCTLHRHNGLQRKALPLAIGLIACGAAGTAWAQATNGTIYGTVPVAPDETVQITSSGGFNRSVPVGASGKYSITLPVGSYTVSLLQNGQVVQSRSNVSPVAAGAVAVDFTTASAANATNLDSIHVTANTIPPIDVTTTNQVTTITAQQLQELPLGRTAEDIAMLAPGVGMGSPNLASGPLGNTINVFGGASTAENAYYVDGMNTTDALAGQGGVALPYGTIEQQQTFISGYGAEYGRSIGGVINQIGKSGTNDWHFGVRAQWEPASLRSDDVNYTWANPRWTQPGQQFGQIEDYNRDDRYLETIYDAYASGPIIKDKLFFFASIEKDDATGSNTGRYENPYTYDYTTHSPKLYAKITWNINDSNVLNVSALQNSYKIWQSVYDFDYGTLQKGDFDGLGQTAKTSFTMWVANYTSYLTDNLTFNAMLGKTRGEYWTQQPAYAGYNPALPYIASASLQNPAFLPPGDTLGIRNAQNNSAMPNSGHTVDATNYRLSLDWKLGDHDLKAGIDNINTYDIDDGYSTTGPGYFWAYGLSNPNLPLVGSNPDVAPYVAPPGTNAAGTDGYYVAKMINQEAANVRVTQRAQYIEDNWQIASNLLLNLGIRNDQFTNYNSAGIPFIRLTKPQWAPRLGFSWDVHGDASLKVFGNAGRYFLALPSAVGADVSAPTLKTGIYGTYTGVDPTTGIPTGFTPLPQNPATGVSLYNQYGEAADPRTVASQNIKAEYSDNYVLGLQQQFHMLGTSWVFTATGTWQKMNRIIDDFDDIQAECAAGLSQGYSWLTPENCGDYATGLLLLNPGSTSDILMPGPDGQLHKVVLTGRDQGFTMGPKRRYYSLDLSLEHVWDGKWFAKIDYVFARNWGNDEGPVETQTGTSGASYVSHTTAWDFPQLMEYSNGLLPNDRRHQIKIYGAYALTPEWKIAGNIYIASGVPNICQGYYGPGESDPLGYGSDYHWCGGVPSPIGSNGFMPWVHLYNFNLDYKPKWAGGKLDFGLAVFNVFNKQTPLFKDDRYGSTLYPNNDYNEVQATESPRMFRFTVAYDF